MAEVRWISVKPGLRAEREAVSRFLGTGVLVTMLGGIALCYFKLGPDHPNFQGVWLFVVGAFVGVLMLLPGSRQDWERWDRFRLGASVSEAFFENAPDELNLAGDPKSGTAPWDKVFFDDDRLLIGDHLLSFWVGRGRGAQGTFVFDRDELIRVILFHVPNGNINRTDILDAALYSTQKWSIALIVAAVVIVGIIWSLVSFYL